MNSVQQPTPMTCSVLECYNWEKCLWWTTIIVSWGIQSSPQAGQQQRRGVEKLTVNWVVVQATCGRFRGELHRIWKTNMMPRRRSLNSNGKRSTLTVGGTLNYSGGTRGIAWKHNYPSCTSTHAEVNVVTGGYLRVYGNATDISGQMGGTEIR